MLRAAIVVASLGVLAACTTTETPSATTTASTSAARAATVSVSADAEGKAILDKSCSSCHGVAASLDRRRSATEWDAIVQRMIDKGAVVAAPDVPKLTAYLVKHHGS